MCHPQKASMIDTVGKVLQADSAEPACFSEAEIRPKEADDCVCVDSCQSAFGSSGAEIRRLGQDRARRKTHPSEADQHTCGGCLLRGRQI